MTNRCYQEKTTIKGKNHDISHIPKHVQRDPGIGHGWGAKGKFGSSRHADGHG
jgi:hypothetical protein